MPSEAIPEGLLDAAVAAMGPYARRLLASGIAFGRLEARLRELFVEVAAQEFAGPSGAPTDSRIAILTGINRKEVRRIRALDRRAAPRTFRDRKSTRLNSSH